MVVVALGTDVPAPPWRRLVVAVVSGAVVVVVAGASVVVVDYAGPSRGLCVRLQQAVMRR